MAARSWRCLLEIRSTWMCESVYWRMCSCLLTMQWVLHASHHQQFHTKQLWYLYGWFVLSPSLPVSDVRVEHPTGTEHGVGHRGGLWADSVFIVNISYDSGINNLARFLSAGLQVHFVCVPPTRLLLCLPRSEIQPGLQEINQTLQCLGQLHFRCCWECVGRGRRGFSAQEERLLQERLKL